MVRINETCDTPPPSEPPAPSAMDSDFVAVDSTVSSSASSSPRSAPTPFSPSSRVGSPLSLPQSCTSPRCTQATTLPCPPTVNLPGIPAYPPYRPRHLHPRPPRSPSVCTRTTITPSPRSPAFNLPGVPIFPPYCPPYPHLQSPYPNMQTPYPDIQPPYPNLQPPGPPPFPPPFPPSPLGPPKYDSEFTTGELSLYTKDSTVFFVHQELLRLASKPLADLVNGATFAGQLELREVPSRAVRALLQWIYPTTTMQIPDFGALSDAFVIANKYNLGAMRGALIDLLSQPNSPVNIRNDPVMAYSIALTYGLSAEAQTASRLAIGKVDFRQEGVWDELKRKGVLLESATKLSQKQFAWEGALADCLLRAPMASGGELLLKKQEWEMLECARCVGWDGPRDGPTGLLKWQQLWAEKVYARLLCTPLNDCAYMFRPRYVIGMWSEGCEGCLVQLVKSQLVLDLWMDRVWKMLEKRWTGIFGDM